VELRPKRVILEGSMLIARDKMGSFSLTHWMVVLVIILIVFGAGKLPRVMGDFAKGIKNFKAGMKDDDDLASTPSKLEDTGTPTDHKA
jgi:sec-independent protein translocase protein TatA